MEPIYDPIAIEKLSIGLDPYQLQMARIIGILFAKAGYDSIMQAAAVTNAFAESCLIPD